MVSSALELSINLSGTMVLVIYLTTLLFSMWGIEKFMKPRTLVMEGICVGTRDSDEDEDEETEEEGETQEEADAPSEEIPVVNDTL